MKLLSLLVGGAIINVAVAWGCAVFSEPSDSTFYTPYSTDHVLAENNFGWPLRTLTNDTNPKVGGTRRYSLNLGDTPLPVLPLWPGFAINTIFYAAIVWGLFTAPGMIRRRVRRTRGQCAACGYSLRGRGTPDGTKCPECCNPVYPRSK